MRQPDGSTAEFTGRFVELTVTETQAMAADYGVDAELGRRVLVGWSGVTDRDGNELEFSAERRDVLLERPCCAFAVARAYLDAMRLGRDQGN